jgi:hypothetical protein
MPDERPIEEVIERFDAFLLKHHASIQALALERQEFIERELLDLRALWWGFDPIDLKHLRESIDDEYDYYVLTCFATLRDGGDLEPVVFDSLGMMAMTNRVSSERVVRFCDQLREWWSTK